MRYDNCMVLKANTLTYANVHVECKALWSKDAELELYQPEDKMDWAWRVREATKESTGETISATSVPTLMKKYNISSFQYAKIDIEGSEYQVFTEKTSKDWISGFDMLSMESHPSLTTPEGADALDSYLMSKGFAKTQHHEYEFWASEELQAHL